MGMIHEPRPRWQRILRNKGWVATVLVTVVTLVLVSGVVLITTNVGCGAEDQIGVKLARCTVKVQTAANHSPAPAFIPSPSAKGGPFYPPASNPGTFYPPQNNPGTYYPPQNNPGTSYPPNYPPGSSGQPPVIPFASGYPPAAAALSCSLPAYAGPPGSGGFISFPNGTFTADPRSAVALPSPGPQQGPGYGGYYVFGTTYDRAHSRWLPVLSQYVSPDGNHFAYPGTSGIYVVDASNNSQVEIGEGRSWILLRVLNDRVYATGANAPGLWIVPFSGTPTQVTADGFWRVATATYAFGSSTSAVPQGATQPLLRLEISTGKVSDWFSQPGAQANVVGFDANGVPLVQASYAQGWELWLVASANSGEVIANSNENFNINGAMVADSHGVWFPIYVQYTGQGIGLYIPGQGIYMVANIGAQIAGGCA